MTREEFDAVLRLEDVFELRTQFIRGHRGKGRYWATLVYKPNGVTLMGHYAHSFARTEKQAIQNLIQIYANS